MYYQDHYVRGKILRRGARECDNRFALIKPILDDLEPPFSVLDLGANVGYFSFRTAYEYPESTVTIVEAAPYINSLYTQNALPNTNLIQKVLNLEEIKALGQFDLILAMSVLHHFEDPIAVLEVLKSMSPRVVLEVYNKGFIPVYKPDKVDLIFDAVSKLNPAYLGPDELNQRGLYLYNSTVGYVEATVHPGCGAASENIKNLTPSLLPILGYTPFPGTLNIKLDKAVSLKNPKTIGKYYKLYPLYCNGTAAFCIRPSHIKNPTDEFELLAPLKLRESLGLADGSRVHLTIDRKYIY